QRSSTGRSRVAHPATQPLPPVSRAGRDIVRPHSDRKPFWTSRARSPPAADSGNGGDARGGTNSRSLRRCAGVATAAGTRRTALQETGIGAGFDAATSGDRALAIECAGQWRIGFDAHAIVTHAGLGEAARNRSLRLPARRSGGATLDARLRCLVETPGLAQRV